MYGLGEFVVISGVSLVVTATRSGIIILQLALFSTAAQKVGVVVFLHV